MDLDRLVEEAAQEMKKCAKCGACRSVCPVFDAENQVEKFAARGKLSLFESVHDAEIPISKKFRSVIDNCLLCLACVKNCSSGVRADKIILAARALAVAQKGQAPVKAAVYRGVLASPAATHSLFKQAARFQHLALKKVPEKSGLRLRFPFNGADLSIPAFQQTTFREILPEQILQASPADSVLLMTGCSVNHLMPQIGHAAVRILKRLNVDIIIPKDQGCCGAPVEAGGDWKTLDKIARQNLSLLSRHPDCKIITLCASGGYMLKKKYPELFARDEEWGLTSRSIAEQTYDISEYLAVFHRERLKQILNKTGAALTYHDPCHLIRGQQIFSEPRELLNMTLEDPLRQMSRPDRCCGSAGSYGPAHLKNYRHILADKIRDIETTRVHRIATGCPACIIALKDGLERAGYPEDHYEVKHTVEFLAEALTPNLQKP